MRRHRRLVLLAAVLALPVPAAAKFGIVKTKVTLPRFRPPLLQMGGRTVAVEIVSESRGVGRRHESVVREQLEGALRSWGAFELRRPGDEADNVVRVHLEDLEARIESTIEYETRYVKVGTREEWDDKKKKYVTKDVYDNRREPVTVKLVTGRLQAQVELVRDGEPRTAPADADYNERFKGESSLPREAQTERDLEEYLVEQAALQAVAAVCYSPDPVEALLAVDGDLKPGNRLAESGDWGARPGRVETAGPQGRQGGRPPAQRGRGPRGAGLQPAGGFTRAPRAAGGGRQQLRAGARAGPRREVLRSPAGAHPGQLALRGGGGAVHGRPAGVTGGRGRAGAPRPPA